MTDLVIKRLKDSICVKQQLIADEKLLNEIVTLSLKIANCLQLGGKIVICGNGGSASDALHFAGEIVGRFQRERDPWPAVVLNADVATLTAIANDYGYEEVFARQTKAHLNTNDIFIGISTSGNSVNVAKAVKVARNIGATTSALLGTDGGLIGKLVDYPIIIHSNTTARVQESHICLIHIICELVENILSQTNQ